MIKKILVALALALAGNGYATKTPNLVQSTEATIAKPEAKEKRSFLHRYLVRDTKTKTALNCAAKTGALICPLLCLIPLKNINKKMDNSQKILGYGLLSLTILPAIRELFNYEPAEHDTPTEAAILEEINTQE